MFRYCFGEFFFRSVVMEYFEGPILGDTIVNMAFLLEANEYNVVDVDTVMKRQAETGNLGEYAISDESYVIYGRHENNPAVSAYDFFVKHLFSRFLRRGRLCSRQIPPVPRGQRNQG